MNKIFNFFQVIKNSYFKIVFIYLPSLASGWKTNQSLLLKLEDKNQSLVNFSSIFFTKWSQKVFNLAKQKMRLAFENMFAQGDKVLFRQKQFTKLKKTN